MEKFKKLFVLTIMIAIITGCGKIPTLKNGEEAVATTDKGSISTEELYQKLKVKNGASVINDMIDTVILNSMYKDETDEEKKYIEEQISSIKEAAEQYNTTYSYMIKYYGFSDEDELKDYFSLTYKRKEAVEKYIADSLSDKEIKKYYEDEIYGDIRVKHILISPDTNDEMTTEQKSEAEANAKKEAQSIITQLNNGADFDELAKEKSDDTATASKGGDLGWISTDEDFVQEFLDAAFKLEKGKYTASPVKTTHGYHIIYKTDEKSKPKFDKVKQTIIDKLVEEKLNDDSTLYYDTLEKIREDNNMKIIDTDLSKLYKEYNKSLKENAKSTESQS
jgi:foldase protein PrsA